jgi:hypothetical protein
MCAKLASALSKVQVRRECMPEDPVQAKKGHV